MPKANGPPREVLLWVTPASGWLPIFLPETAGPLKPGVRTTGLGRTWVSSARGVSAERFLDRQHPLHGRVGQGVWGRAPAAPAAAWAGPLGLGGATEAPASLSQALGIGTGSDFHTHTHTYTHTHWQAPPWWPRRSHLQVNGLISGKMRMGEKQGYKGQCVCVCVCMCVCVCVPGSDLTAAGT